MKLQYYCLAIAVHYLHWPGIPCEILNHLDQKSIQLSFEVHVFHNNCAMIVAVNLFTYILHAASLSKQDVIKR